MLTRRRRNAAAHALLLPHEFSCVMECWMVTHAIRIEEEPMLAMHLIIAEERQCYVVMTIGRVVQASSRRERWFDAGMGRGAGLRGGT